MARDMSYAQFKLACERNGLRPILGGTWLEDLESPGKSALSYGGILHPKTFKLLRRETLAHALKRRKENRQKGPHQ